MKTTQRQNKSSRVMMLIVIVDQEKARSKKNSAGRFQHSAEPVAGVEPAEPSF